MSNIKIAIFLFISCLVSGFTGAAAGYYAAIKVPASANIAVLDIEAASKSINPEAPDYLLKTNALSEKIKTITGQLNANGIVVLDRASVVSAPEESIIHVNN
jgi:hypothetical protein